MLIEKGIEKKLNHNQCDDPLKMTAFEAFNKIPISTE